MLRHRKFHFDGTNQFLSGRESRSFPTPSHQLTTQIRTNPIYPVTLCTPCGQVFPSPKKEEAARKGHQSN